MGDIVPLEKLERTYKAVPLKVSVLNFEEYGPVGIIEFREEDGRCSGLELAVWPGGQEGFDRLKGKLVEIHLVSMLDGDEIISRTVAVKELGAETE